MIMKFQNSKIKKLVNIWGDERSREFRNRNQTNTGHYIKLE